MATKGNVRIAGVPDSVTDNVQKLQSILHLKEGGKKPTIEEVYIRILEKGTNIILKENADFIAG